MKIDLDSLSRSRKLLAATLAVSILLGVQIVQRILTMLLDVGVVIAQNNTSWGFPTYLWTIAVGIGAFALGFFLCVWLMAPITSDLPLPAVISRSLLAVVSGAAALFVAVLLGSLFTGFDESAGLVFGWAYGALATASSNMGWVASQSLYSALSTAVSLTPLAVLAAVMAWLWMRAHPVIALTPDDTTQV